MRTSEAATFAKVEAGVQVAWLCADHVLPCQLLPRQAAAAWFQHISVYDGAPDAAASWAEHGQQLKQQLRLPPSCHAGA